ALPGATRFQPSLARRRRPPANASRSQLAGRACPVELNDTLRTTTMRRYKMSTRRFQALRRISLKLAAAGLLCAAFGPAMANDYPTRPISLIASAAPGGTTDIAARMISDPLGKALGQTVVVDNKPGAAGAIAAQSVLRSQ